MILVPREAPFSSIHLENMLKLSNMGAVILPASPGFYHQPQTIDDLVDFVVARILNLLDIPAGHAAALGRASFWQPMNKLRRRCCWALLLTTGCATVRTLDADQAGRAGRVRRDSAGSVRHQGGCCAKDRFGAEAPRYPGSTCPAARCSTRCCCRCRF